MHTLRTLVTLAAVVALGACAAPAPEPMAMTGSAADEQAIRDMMQTYADSWSAGDQVGILAMMSDDYQEVSPDGMHRQGRAALEEMMAEEFANRPEGMSMSVSTTFVQWQSADVASVGGTFAMSGLPEEAPPGMPTDGSFLVVVRREADGWKVVNGIGSPNIPEPDMGG